MVVLLPRLVVVQWSGIAVISCGTNKLDSSLVLAFKNLGRSGEFQVCLATHADSDLSLQPFALHEAVSNLAMVIPINTLPRIRNSDISHSRPPEGSDIENPDNPATLQLRLKRSSASALIICLTQAEHILSFTG